MSWPIRWLAWDWASISDSPRHIGLLVARWWVRHDHEGREFLWQRLSFFVSDLSIYEALTKQLRRYPPGSIWRRALQAWLDALNEGKTFPEALEDWVPPEERLLISAGFESDSGNPASGFQDAQTFRKDLRVLREAAISVLLYPLGLLVFVGVILALASQFLLPMLEEILPVFRWPLPARAFHGLMEFIGSYGLSIAVGMAMMLLIAVWSLPRWSDRNRADRFIPWSWFRLYQGAAVLMALSALLQSKIPLDAALAKVARISNPWTKARIQNSLLRLSNAAEPGVALDTGLWTKEVAMDIRDLAESGHFDSAIFSVSREIVRNTDKAIRRTTLWLKAVLLVLTVILILWLVGSVFLVVIQSASTLSTL